MFFSVEAYTRNIMGDTGREKAYSRPTTVSDEDLC